ncbi:thiopurine S-methyltransferase-like [Rana temporaria]|uniref:thiopurine S-methyltransferase-like n=1 Tax=Rana temporaria TaxID=8407 RepID=UPI001AAC6C13|nr:thiopurine S-methyltransferase-like [Rana temporaria]
MSDCPNVTERIQDTVFTVMDWNEKWKTRQIGFHEKDVHPFFAEFLDEMKNGREKLNIFFPLCGKAVDMKWLADMGHNIVGVDVVEIALKEFFEEQNVPYVEESVAEIPGAKVFKSTSGNISLYCCNFYDISDSIIGRFDGIWDRGALVAVNPCDRERYGSVLLSLLNKDSRYLMVVFEYDPKLMTGPPFYVPESDIERLFGSACSYKLLKKIDALTENKRKCRLDYYYQKIYLVTPKSNS